jgi:hypothetical protein
MVASELSLKNHGRVSWPRYLQRVLFSIELDWLIRPVEVLYCWRRCSDCKVDLSGYALLYFPRFWNWLDMLTAPLDTCRSGCCCLLAALELARLHWLATKEVVVHFLLLTQEFLCTHNLCFGLLCAKGSL